MLLVLDPDELTGFYGGKYSVSAEDNEIYLVTELGAIPRKGKYSLTSLDEDSLTPIGADWIAADGGLTAPAVPAVVGETTFEGRLPGAYEADAQINLIDTGAGLIVANDWRHPTTILGNKLKLLYDNQDLSTMFSDFASTPATWGSSVAMQLDMLQGGALGSDIKAAFTPITNGSPSGPFAYDGVTGAGSLTETDGSNFYALYWGGLTNGRLYAVDIENTGANPLSVRDGGYAFPVSVAAGQRKTVYVVISNFGLTLRATNSGTIADFLVHSVKEVLGTPRYNLDETKRAILGRHPVGGRRNLLISTDDFSNPVWSNTNVTLTTNAALGPDDTMSLTKVEATASASTNFLQSATATGSASGDTYSIYARKGSGAIDANQFILRNVTTATVVVWIVINYDTGALTYVVGTGPATATDCGSGLWRIPLTAATGISAGDDLSVYACFTGSSETAGEYAYVGHPQLEPGSTATAYQAVTTAYDVTESGVEDAVYLKPDGSNDFWVTPSLDLTHTDNIAVFCAMRKINDTGVRFYMESSADASSTSGAFGIAAPHTAAPSYRFRSRGGTAVTNGALASYTDYTAPNTAVLTGLADISSDTQIMRINGGEVSVSTEDQGTGNFTSQQYYFYSRGGTSFFFDGYDYGFALADSAPSDMQITKMEFYYNSIAATGTWVPDGASLHLDFLNGRYWCNNRFQSLSSIMSLTRAGEVVGYATNSAGLLNEETRTNLIDNSSDLSTWMDAATATADGTWWLLEDNNTGGFDSRYKIIPVLNDSLTHVIQMEVKKTSGGTSPTFGVNLTLVGGSPVGAHIRLNTDTGYNFNTSLNVVDRGDRWFIWWTAANNSTGNTDLVFAIYPATGPYGGSDVPTAVGSQRVRYPQVEVGSFPTTYIPTYGSTVTRAADVASVTGANFPPWFNNAEGTIVVEAQACAPITQDVVQLGSASVNDSMSIYFDGGVSAYGYVLDDGALQAAPGSTVDTTHSFKTAFSYKHNQFQTSVDGGTVVTDSSGTVPTLDRLLIGPQNLSSASKAFWLRRITCYPVAHTGSALQALSA